MEIGACGIACGICRFRGMCAVGGCVAGTDKDAAKKLETQKSKLGFNCPVLECAFESKVDYCLKDCDRFPCEVHYRGFPYSKAFLSWCQKQKPGGE